MAVAGHDQCPRELEGATVLPVYTLVSNCVVAFLDRKFFYLSPTFRSMELVNAPPELIILGKGGGLHEWCKGANICNAELEEGPRSILKEGVPSANTSPRRTRSVSSVLRTLCRP